MGEQARWRRQRREARRLETASAPTPKPPWYRGPRSVCVAVAVALAIIVAVVFHRDRPSAAPTTPRAPGGPYRVAELEPNDTPEKAELLPRLPVEVMGELTAGDQDLYRVVVADPGGHLLDAWVEGGLKARLRVTRADGIELASVVTPERIGALGLTKGVFLLGVRGADSAATGHYRLQVRIAPWGKGLDWEPDDDPEHAQDLERLEDQDRDIARYRAVGWWSQPGDVDCFRTPLIVPAAGAEMRAELAPPSGVRAHLTVYDSGHLEHNVAPKELAEASGAVEGAPAILPALGERSWEAFYTVCTNATSGSNFADRYTLAIRSFTPDGPFEFEPNNARDTASALPLGIALHGYLTPGDVDFFRISGGLGYDIEVNYQAIAGVAAEMRLLDEQGNEIARETGDAGENIVTQGEATFVELRAVLGGSVNGTYQLSATRVKTGGR